MGRRGSSRAVTIFGNLRIYKTNPWFRVNMSKKDIYLARPPPWYMNANKLSPKQREVIEIFKSVAENIKKDFPKDGKFSTHVNRVVEIGRRVRAEIEARKKAKAAAGRQSWTGGE